MSAKLKTIATLGFAFVFSGMCASSIMGQQAPVTAQQPLRVIQYNGDMANILGHLPSTFGRTIGLEVDPRKPFSTVEFYLTDPTLADVLNAITKSSAIYRWSEREDSIEVVPVRGGSPLLETRISNFRVDYADEAEVITQMLNLPEVEASMNDMRLRYRDPGNTLARGARKKMTFALQDVSVRQVLNKIANENGSRFWIWRGTDNGFFSISILPRD